MDALEAVLRPVANLLNKNIQESTPAREQCAELSGTVIAIRVRDSALAAYFRVFDDSLDIVTSAADEPDVIISGSLITLAKMVGQSGEAAVQRGTLDLTGDVAVANQFQQLLSYAKPDLEEELSAVVGDVAAHQLGEMARGLGRWGRDARTTMGENIREYLQEESRDAPSRYEVERFGGDVNKLRDDVDRLEARINRLRDEN